MSFGSTKARYQGLAKNDRYLAMPFALEHIVRTEQMLKTWDQCACCREIACIHRKTNEKIGHNARFGSALEHQKVGPDGNRKSTYSFKEHINIDKDVLLKLWSLPQTAFMTQTHSPTYSAERNHTFMPKCN